MKQEIMKQEIIITDEKLIIKTENSISEYCLNNVLEKCKTENYDIYDFISEEFKKIKLQLR